MDQELNSGVIWEPRVLWDVQNSFDQTLAVEDNPFQVKFSKYNLRNGGQYPIELRYMLLAPVGYSFNEYLGLHDPAESSPGDYGACAAVIQNAKIMLSVPNRQHYALAPLPVTSFVNVATGDVPVYYGSAGDRNTGASGLHNVCRWDFDEDRRLILPRGAACTFQIGTILGQPSGVDDAKYASVGFYDDGVGHAGSKAFLYNSRIRAKAIQMQNTASPSTFPWQPADGLGSTAGATKGDFPGAQTVSFRDFKLQETERDGYTMVRGYAVAIEQIDYDDALIGSGMANAVTGRAAPLALRTPVRAACDAMSQEWWWRDGAPLALVCPTMTPALVYRLPKPITLHKGDHIEAEMQVPGGVVIDATQHTANARFQIGISFAGYAAIKG